MVITLFLILLGLMLIGAVVGAVKGYSKCSFWGIAVLFSVLFCKIIARLASNFGGNGVYLLSLTFSVLVLFIIIFVALKKGIENRIASRKEFSNYQQYDDREENKERILIAIDNNDDDEYKAQVKRKHRFKDSAGGWGAFDRVLGCISVAVNVAMWYAIIISIFLIFVDFSQINFFTKHFGSLLNRGIWTKLGAKLALDIIFVSTLYASLKLGYKTGISNTIYFLFVVCLIGLSAYLAFHLAFRVEAFGTIAEKAATGSLAGIVKYVSVIANILGKENADVWSAKLIIMTLLFVVFLIISIIIAILLPHLVEKLRGVTIVRVIDGAIGALVLTAVVVVLLCVAGYIMYRMYDYEAMKSFNTYMSHAPLADSIYEYNPLMWLFDKVVAKLSSFGG